MTRTTSSGPRRIGGTAVVVGASMAGLCAARVAAERSTASWSSTAIPCRRRPKPDRTCRRAGSRICCWSPAPASSRAGSPASWTSSWPAAPSTSTSAPTSSGTREAASFRRPTSDLHGPAMSRPFLEQAVRRRVAGLPNVAVRDGAKVVGLTVDPSGSRVTGVRLQDGGEVAAELVVDATGRCRAQPRLAAGARLPAAAHIRGPGRHPLRLPRLPPDRRRPNATGRPPPSSTPRRPGGWRWRCRRRATAGWCSSPASAASPRRWPRTSGWPMRGRCPPPSSPTSWPARNRSANRPPTGSRPTSDDTSSRCAGSRSAGSSSATPSAASTPSTARA